MPAKKATAAASPKKKAPSPKKTTGETAHPPFTAMIKKAVKELNEKGGSSKTAIMKYLNANYKVEGKSADTYVRSALRKMVAKNELVHASVKTHGASGSFKLPGKEPVAKKTAKKTSPKKKSPSPLKKSAKKAAAPKIETPVEPQVETPAQVSPPKKVEKSPAPALSKKLVKSPAKVAPKSPAKRGRGRPSKK